MRTPIDAYIDDQTDHLPSVTFMPGVPYTASRRPEDTRTGGVTKDYAFNRKSFDDGEIRNPADNGQVQVGTDGIVVTLEQDFNDADLQRFFSFAINATRGIDPENPPEPTDWEEMMKGGLQTALKRINIAFAVYGASRTLTHQLVRSTRANFHQQSQRAHYYGDRPEVRMPESVWAKPRAREAFLGALAASHRAYQIATEEDVSYQDARFALLEGTTNFILCEYSLDEFIAVYSYRGCSMFQWEIVHTVREMRRVLIEAHPWLDPYIKISCERTKGALDAEEFGLTLSEGDDATGLAHACTYQGWEDVEGQCEFPWARDTNRTFRSERHGIRRRSS